MINLTTLGLMDAQHAINTLRAEHNPLTSTPLEAHLIDWIEQLVEREDPELTAAMENYSLEPKDIEHLGSALIQSAANTVAILEAVGEAGIDSPSSLSAALALAAKFRALASDAGDVFTRLTALATTTQE